MDYTCHSISHFFYYFFWHWVALDYIVNDVDTSLPDVVQQVQSVHSIIFSHRCNWLPAVCDFVFWSPYPCSLGFQLVLP